jgi:hypothetical protein
VVVEVGRVAVLDQPVGGGTQVLHVGVELGPGLRRAGRAGEQAGEVGGVAAAHLGLLAGSAARRWAAYWRNSSCMP